MCTNWSGWFREDIACCLQTPLRLAKRFEAKSLTLGRPDRIEYGKIYLEESMTITIKKLHLAIAVVAIAMIAPAAALATHSFTDVPDGAFYTDPVEWAAANGITLGQTPTEFAPLAPVTRGQSVTFLKRYDDNIVQPELAALQADFAAMQSDLEALMDDVGTLQTDVVVIQSDVGTLPSDVLLIQSDVGTLETLLASVSLETVDGQPTLRFTGVNVQVVDGSGNTAGAINGLGNLIVGYNENSSATRTGSHNLVVGMNNSYTSYGGFVGGRTTRSMVRTRRWQAGSGTRRARSIRRCWAASKTSPTALRRPSSEVAQTPRRASTRRCWAVRPTVRPGSLRRSRVASTTPQAATFPRCWAASATTPAVRTRRSSAATRSPASTIQSPSSSESCAAKGSSPPQTDRRDARPARGLPDQRGPR